MEMKLKGDKFFVLDMEGEKRVFDTDAHAIEMLKSMVSKDKKIDPESVSILEIDTSEESWQIKSLPWSKIAIELMRK